MALVWAHAYRAWSGWTDVLEKELALGREAAAKAVDCDKDDFLGHGALAFAELFARNHERALNAIDRAHFLLGRYEDAIPYLERLVNAGEDILTWRTLLIASYMAAGREDQERTETKVLLESRPNVRCSDILAIVPLRDEQISAQYMKLLNAAGIPE